ncbi:hypothetical protein NCC49_001113 [Naganishia albida]|nr:hypothetical protein NCC49_001113 [Naganishia albida]
MSAPIDSGSDNVHALLARLRAAQSAQGDRDTTSQDESAPFQYSPAAEQGQQNGRPSANHPMYDTSTVFPRQSVVPGSVQSLLSSLQNARRPEYTTSPVSTPPYMSSGYRSINTYQPPQSAGQHYAAPRQSYSYDAQSPLNPSFPTPNARPANQGPSRNQPSPQPTRRSTPPHVPGTAEDPPQPAQVERRASPPRVVQHVPPVERRPSPLRVEHPRAPVPTKSAGYDPYDEDYEPPAEPVHDDDGPLETESGDEAARIEVEKVEAAEKREKAVEEDSTRLKRERNEDDFVNMSFAKASVVITSLMSDEAVLRRLKDMKEEQDKMERTLWQKRLDIVKTHREKMNKAKEEATRLDPKTGETRVLKERVAAKRALNQFYTSRCLPFYDDLHAKHLRIMQQDLGIPGLGRLETRRKNNLGGAERPIAIDTDEEEEAEERKVFDNVVGAVEEGEREKMLARRKKIMNLIESIMSDGVDD